MAIKTFTAGNRLTAADLMAIQGGSRAFFAYHAGTSPTSTTSTSYVDMAGTSQTSITFVKRAAHTAVELQMHVSCAITVAASTLVQFAMQINGADYQVTQIRPEALNARAYGSGVDTPAALNGLAAGTYTVKARWRIAYGSGAATRYAGDDILSMAVREVPLAS